MRLWKTGALLGLLGASAAVARADAPPPPLPTLARALAAIPPPKEGILLAVGADTATMPPNTVAPATCLASTGLSG